MRKLWLAPAILALVALGVAAPAASAQEGNATVVVIHGIPDTDVDVYVNDELTLENFTYETVTDPLSLPAGDYDLAVRAAGADPSEAPLLEATATLTAGANVTVIAHLSEAGEPTLTPFVNDVATTAAGQGRLIVRHTAAAPAVDVLAGGEPVFTDLTNPNEAKADLPAGTVSAAVALAGTTDPVIGPADVPVVEGQATIVYAVGSAEAANLGVLVQTIDGLHSEPAAVNTGNSGLAATGSDSGSLLVPSPWPPRWRRSVRSCWSAAARPPEPPGAGERAPWTPHPPPLPRRPTAVARPCPGGRRPLSSPPSAFWGDPSRAERDRSPQNRLGRWTLRAAVVALALAACGGGDDASSSTTTSSTAPTSTTLAAPPVTAPVIGTQSGRLDALPDAAVVPPVGLRIPSLGIDAPVRAVGVDADGEMEVPAATDVGWYRFGPAPGARGLRRARRPRRLRRSAGRVLRASPAGARCPARRDLRRRNGAGLRGGRDGPAPQGRSGCLGRVRPHGAAPPGPDHLRRLLRRRCPELPGQRRRLRGAGAGRGGVMRS